MTENGLLDWSSLKYYNKNSSGRLAELGQKVRKAGFPVVREDMASFLELICAIKKPEYILEIGCCVGYSAMLMAESSPSLKKLITIERYDYMIERAKRNISEYGFEDRIELLEGQAQELLPVISEKFDLIFLDAAKGQYPSFLPHCRRLLNKDGLFIADNIFMGGKVSGEAQLHHRDKTIVSRMHEFLQELFSAPEFKSALLPVGDGITVSYKIK